MATAETRTSFEPKRPALVAWLVFGLAALSLCWPMVQGQFLAGPNSDMYEAGYSFRAFGAEFFRRYGSIPQWNPYIFGGLPYVGAAHGDIFYPTAWLRWILPADVAINLGFALHIVLAGGAAYGLLRVLRVSWAGAVVGGLAYELTGIVISLVSPGHDGKLFVSALAPVMLTGIVMAVRDRRVIGYGLIALATGLSLQGHPQASYYLVVAGAVWGAFWLFGPEGPKGSERWKVLGGAVGAVVLGVGLYAIYLLPFLEYIPFSPRADAGYNSGWEHATSYALPPQELLGVLLPRIYGGVRPDYFGPNGLRLHSEYLGPVTLLLALLGLGGVERRRLRIALGTIGVLFFLVSLGGHTPFYRLWYELMPMMKKVRGAGMAFFLVALPVSMLAGLGAERLFNGVVATRKILIGGAFFVLLGALAGAGGLQFMAEDIARSPGYEGFIERAVANRPALEADGLRLLALAALGTAGLFLVATRRVRGGAAVALIAVVLGTDLWLVGRRYFVFSPGAAVTYGDDPVTTKIRQTPPPFRVWQPAGQYGGAAAYPGSWLMSRDIPTLFGYHGNEIRYFDDVLGGKNAWPNQANPTMLNLFAVQYLVANQAVQPPGFHLVLGPVRTAVGDTAYLYQTDTVPPYARVVAGAAKLADAQIAATVADPRFPVDRLVVYPDTANVTPEALGNGIPGPSARRATVAEWRPGRIRVTIDGAGSKTEYLVVSENWYRDWLATVDGRAAPVLRGQGTLLSVALPPGSKEVVFIFDSGAYRRGRLLSLASAAGVLLLLGWPLARRGRPSDG